MKKFARAIIAAAMLSVLCFTLCACVNNYASNYSSSKMSISNTSDSSAISFDTYSGTYVIKFNNSGNDKSVITYNASLKEGNIKVYYDFNGEKLDMFEVGTDGVAEGKTEAFANSKTIYVIIESDGKCDTGSFSFSLEKAAE